jgi:UDP-N-acetylglucosamine 2-epimerase (non-hydrolysing)
MFILSIVGARPQFIKEAIFQKEIKNYSFIQKKLIHTGQHYDANMSDNIFSGLEMDRPDFFLNINKTSHSNMVASMMIKIEEILNQNRPDFLVLYGDTNSTLAGALVGKKMNLNVVHIESGLRQKPKEMPEEINRVLTDHCSSILFTPSESANLNLLKENITGSILNVGDIMFDLFLKTKNRFSIEYYKNLNLVKNKYIVCTIHRDFNVDSKEILSRILYSLNSISRKIPVVFPMHPRTLKSIKSFDLSNLLDNLIVIEPLNYFDLMGLVSNCYKVITDSGGLQKEAYFSQKEAIILMPDTAWIELVDFGYNHIATPINLYDFALKTPNEIKIQNIYGNGNASKKIIDFLKLYNK